MPIANRSGRSSARTPGGVRYWCATVLMVLWNWAAGAQSFSIEGRILGGGGGVSTSEVFGVSGVLGESVAGLSLGGNYSIENVGASDVPTPIWPNPAVTAKRVGAAMEITWSSRNGAFQVQESARLDGDSWTDSPGTPVLSKGQWVLTRPAQSDVRFFRLVQFAPILSVTRSGATLELSWSSAAAGFVLQEASAIRGGAWTDVLAPASLLGGRWVVVLPAPSDARFLRLRGP